MDYKFWLPFVATVVGLGFQVWQISIARKDLKDIPSTRSPRRIATEKALLRKMYRPVILMGVMILLCWLPYIIEAAKPTRLPVFMVGWSGAVDGCNGMIDTSSFMKAKDKYRLFLACEIFDPTVDPLQDDKIAVSKPFQITGGIVAIVILYEPNDPIRAIAKLGTNTNHTVFLLPEGKDGSSIKRLADVEREGGQILLPGGTLKD